MYFHCYFEDIFDDSLSEAAFKMFKNIFRKADFFSEGWKGLEMTDDSKFIGNHQNKLHYISSSVAFLLDTKC